MEVKKEMPRKKPRGVRGPPKTAGGSKPRTKHEITNRPRRTPRKR